ncbi:MAG: response regulator transcription factor [Chitinophagales bacterium]|jgi:DNA-binding response OmpR family regulator|nr:response regulator [Sphingobacteriales bacterium]
MMSAKLLLVDDEPNILLSLDFLMRKNGFQVLLARNGTEAMQLLKEQTPDLVILDIMMPDVDGYQICQFIKGDEILQSTKVIFLSAKSKESDIAKGLELGADAYMTKPFANKALLEKVKELIS